MNNSILFVGGLPYSVSDTQLSELFSRNGSVESAHVMTDRMTGRSRGFGFVEMSTQPEAETAIVQLNGAQMEGRNLTVSEAKPKTSNGGSARDRW